jgi:hypothetical protein
MELRAELAIATAVTITATIIDLPLALVGLAFGVISHYLPYGTIVIAVGGTVIAAVGEFVYPAIGRATEPSLGSFFIGLFAIAGTASSVHVTMRNWKNRR